MGKGGNHRNKCVTVRLFCILNNFRKERWLSKETSGAPAEVILEKEEGAYKDLQNNKIFPDINKSLGAIHPSSG